MLQEHIQSLKTHLDNEKPTWRFKWGLWPILTKGWPFNRDATHFSQLVHNELQQIEPRINAKMTAATGRIAEEAALMLSPLPRVRSSVELLLIAQTEAKVTILLNENSKSPSQSLAPYVNPIKENEQKVENEKPAEENAEARFLQWASETMERITACEKQQYKTSLQIFSDLEAMLSIQTELLSYRDNLSATEAENLIEANINMMTTLNTHKMAFEKAGNVYGGEQCYLFTLFLNNMASESNSTQRKSISELLLSEASKHFSKEKKPKAEMKIPLRP